MKNRSIKELLEIMLDNEKHFAGGLCTWNVILKYYQIINIDEYCIIRNYIRQNKPEHADINSYYWPINEKEPRIEWINEHIKLNS